MFLAQHPVLLSFFFLSIRKREEERRREWLKDMGILVTPAQIHNWASSGGNARKKAGPAVQELYIPYIAQMKGQEYYKELSKSVPLTADENAPPPAVNMGDYVPEDADEEIISLANSGKEEWMKFMRSSGIYDPKIMEERATRARERNMDPEELEKKLERLIDEESNKPLSDVSKEEFQRKFQQVLGTAPLHRKDEE
jgi:hypothetical protein